MIATSAEKAYAAENFYKLSQAKVAIQGLTFHVFLLLRMLY